MNRSNEPYDCETDTLDEVRSLTEIKVIEQKDVCLIDWNDCPKNELELIDFSKPEPETELIDLREFSKLEPELIDFSDSEPELEYLPKPKSLEIDMSLRVCTDKFDISKKEIGSKSNDRSGISPFTAKRVFRSKSNDKVKISPSETAVELFPGIFDEDFSNPFAEFGRVQVARRNLEIKILYIYLVF